MKTYIVKNHFYFRGGIQLAGTEITLSEDQVADLLPKDVLGREIKRDMKPPEPPTREPYTLDEFSALSAPDQKGELVRLNIGADASNKEDRIAVYAAHLAGDPNAEDQTGGAAAGGAGGPEDNQVTA